MLEGLDVLIRNEIVVDGRDGVLPNQLLGRNLGTEVADLRPHIAMGKLEPSPGKGVGKLIGILEETS